MSNPEPTVRLEFKPYKRRFKHPFKTGIGDFHFREGIIIRVLDRDGRTGYGEITPWSLMGTESFKQCYQWCTQHQGQWKSVAVLGDWAQKLPCCMFALDMALWMMHFTESVPLRRVPLCGYLPAGENALDVLEHKLGLGFLSFKWKVGVEPLRQEHTLFLKLWKRLQVMGGSLRLDPNGAWSLEDANQWLALLESYPIDYIEQPLGRGREDVMEALNFQYSTPLALDDSIRKLQALEVFGGKFKVLVIKPAWLGQWSRLHEVLGGLSARVIYSSSLETLIGASGILFRIAQQSGPIEPVGFGVDGIFEDDLGLQAEAFFEGLPAYPKMCDTLWSTLTQETLCT